MGSLREFGKSDSLQISSSQIHITCGETGLKEQSLLLQGWFDNKNRPVVPICSLKPSHYRPNTVVQTSPFASSVKIPCKTELIANIVMKDKTNTTAITTRIPMDSIANCCNA
ncbi:MAG: hypothetical protein ACRECH_10985, partial [Nitrososphaerales archaeon]